MRKAGWMVCALLSVVSFALPGFGADEVFERTVPLVSGGSFEIRNINGPVTVVGWDREAVDVYAVKTASQGDNMGSRVHIDVAASPDSVSVTTVSPSEEAAEVAVTYTVRVPRHVRLTQVSTVNGAVRVSGVEATGELRSVNGNIEVSDSAGGLSARTTNGDIHMAFARLTALEALAVETVNGAIVLGLPADASALLEAGSIKGTFRSELPLLVTSAYGTRGIHGRLGDGDVTVRLHTVNGTIRVEALPKGT